MFSEPLSVAPTGAPDGSLSSASLENNTPTPEVTPNASSAESNAAVTTPQVEQPLESVGIQQLRTQYNALKNDLNLYKPAHEFLEKHGGFERAQEVVPTALNIYSEMIKGEGFDPFNVAEAFYNQEPDNFAKFAMALPDIYPPLKAAMEEKIRAEMEATYGQSQVPAQNNNLELDESDPYQARMAALERENKQLREEFAPVKQAQQQSAQDRIKQQSDERFETLALSKLRTAFKEPLAQLQGWNEQQMEKLTRDIKAGLDENPKFAEVMDKIESAARAGAQGRLIDLIPEAKKILSAQQKQSIEYFSKIFGQQVQASQALRATQTARREINTNGSGAPTPQPNNYSRPNDPNLQADLVADIERQFANRR